VHRFLNKTIPEEYEPTIEESYVKTISKSFKDCKSMGEEASKVKKEEDELVEVEILDTAGMEEYTALRDLYFKSGDAFMLVYAIDSLSSFHELNQIYQRLRRIKGDHVRMQITFKGVLMLISNLSF
jgi:GTPase SAR1 family protein